MASRMIIVVLNCSSEWALDGMKGMLQGRVPNLWDTGLSGLAACEWEDTDVLRKELDELFRQTLAEEKTVIRIVPEDFDGDADAGQHVIRGTDAAAGVLALLLQVNEASDGVICAELSGFSSSLETFDRFFPNVQQALQAGDRLVVALEALHDGRPVSVCLSWLAGNEGVEFPAARKAFVPDS